MIKSDPPYVSVILPCRNEVKSIRSCLESVVGGDFPKDELELLVADGQSDDGTREIVLEFSKRHPWIRLIDNVRRITPAAMNIGIQSARPDRHHTPKAHTIAFALSHPWGVGNAHYRIGTTEPKWVDTVPFGCYKREVFDRIGLFDEALVRNQDDELNHRLIKRGGRILLVPEIVAFYTAKESLGKLWLMYYQYGYYKPLAVRKIGAVMTARQLVPSVFVMSLVLTASLAPWSNMMAVLFIAIVIVYVALDLSISARAAFNKGVSCGL